jgi:hypothetical protein
MVAGIRGGWSPSYLNWDDGVPAKAACSYTTPQEAIEVLQGTPSELKAVEELMGARHDGHDAWLRVPVAGRAEGRGAASRRASAT